MTKEELLAVVSQPEYDFLRIDPHLGNRIMFLTIGGSHAYGTNIEGSDIDVRGCAMNSKQDLLGLSNFEQRVNLPAQTYGYGRGFHFLH